MKSADEILSFLVKAWAEDSSLKYRRGESFRCRPDENIVYIPDYYGDHLPKLSGLPRWRIWRFTSFHEAMHMLYSPPNKSETVRSIHMPFSKQIPEVNFVDWAYSIIEDYRIEKLGLRTYVGYVPEQKFSRTVYASQSDGLRERISKLDPPFQMLNWFLESLLLDVDPQLTCGDDSMFLDEILELARPVESEADLISATTQILQKFIDRFEFIPPIEIPVLPLIGLIRIEDEAIPKSDSSKNTEAISVVLQEFEQVQSEAETRAKISAEKTSMIRKTESRPRAGFGLLTPRKPVNKVDPYRILENTKVLTNRLIQYLRKWKVGWDEVLDYQGDDIDTESYLIGREESARGKFFIDEQLISPKTNIAILLDMSGSIDFADLDFKYKQAIVVIGTALDRIGIKFSIFVFQDPYLWLLKIKNEKWSRLTLEYLAGIRAMGGTPLAGAIDLSMEFQSHEGFKRLVIITDGEPNSPEYAERSIKQAERRGVQVSILGFIANKELKYTSFFDLVSRRPGRVKLINSIDEMPVTFFDLLRTKP
jgi:hypothetical protein